MERGWDHGDEVPKEYVDLVQPHVESMNYFYTDGVHAAVESLKPVQARAAWARQDTHRSRRTSYKCTSLASLPPPSARRQGADARRAGCAAVRTR